MFPNSLLSIELKEDIKKLTTKITFKIQHLGNFLDGPVAKNPPCNAGDSGSTPGQETKISHARKQLESESVTTTEWKHSRAGSPQQEKPAHCNKDPVQPNIEK